MEQEAGLSPAVPANSWTAPPRRCAQWFRTFCICAVTMLASKLKASATTCISSERLAWWPGPAQHGRPGPRHPNRAETGCSGGFGSAGECRNGLIASPNDSEEPHARWTDTDSSRHCWAHRGRPVRPAVAVSVRNRFATGETLCRGEGLLDSGRTAWFGACLCRPTPRAHCPKKENRLSSGCGPMVVAEHSAEALSALNRVMG
jgi:hypothetical protein